MRPGYPDGLIKQILNYSRITPGARILEIGCGTGQATQSFARRDFQIIGLEPGPEMAEIVQSKFQDDPQISIQATSFEDWELEEEAFDLIFSATAFHWIPQEIGFYKAAAALRQHGTLALFWNKHPGPYPEIYHQINQVYQTIVPERARKDTDNALRHFEESIKTYIHLINETGYFEEVNVHLYPWSQQYSTHQYLKLLDTYSDHRALPDERRAALYDGIAEIIDKAGGILTKDYIALLYLTRKK
jgi:trans-aconitate methyltransferase